MIFAYHGYPWLIHRLTYRRAGHANLHVRGYTEEGTTTTPFDGGMLNNLDRYHLVIDVPDRTPGLIDRYGPLKQRMIDARLEARQYTREHGEDIPGCATGRGTRPGEGPEGSRIRVPRGPPAGTMSSGSMGRSIYLASPEGHTGKSAVALGLLHLLARRVESVGVFRPVTRSRDERDTVVELLLREGVDVAYEQALAVTSTTSTPTRSRR